MYPNTGVKQGCPLSPMLFSLYINDVDEIALQGVQGAVTGTTGSSVTHMLYADNLANNPDAMQTMLNRLHWYAQRKHLIIGISKIEGVHFNLSG